MRKLVPVGVVVAMSLAACGGGGVAATVNGDDVAVGEVEAVPHAVEGPMDRTQFAGFLTLLIQWTAAEQAAADQFGIDPSEDEIAAEIEELMAAFGSGESRQDFMETQNISESALDRAGRQGVIEEGVAGELTADVADPTPEEVAQRVELLGEVCARHVLVATEEAAQDVIDRLEAGEDFAEVAGEASTDPTAAESGGELGCAQPLRYAPEFAEAVLEAEIGEVAGPVETQFGFHVVIVDERTPLAEADIPSDEELRQSLMDERSAQAVNEWFIEVITAAEVSVEEEYGTWSASPTPRVTPPAG